MSDTPSSLGLEDKRLKIILATSIHTSFPQVKGTSLPFQEFFHLVLCATGFVETTINGMLK